MGLTEAEGVGQAPDEGGAGVLEPHRPLDVGLDGAHGHGARAGGGGQPQARDAVMEIERCLGFEPTDREFEKLDSGTIRFDVDIPSEGARTIEYTVVYTW